MGNKRVCFNINVLRLSEAFWSMSFGTCFFEICMFRALTCISKHEWGCKFCCAAWNECTDHLPNNSTSIRLVDKNMKQIDNTKFLKALFRRFFGRVSQKSRLRLYSWLSLCSTVPKESLKVSGSIFGWLGYQPQGIRTDAES